MPVLTLVACGGDDMATTDAQPSCAATAEPHDEDGDAIFDACDNCPSIANAGQSDVAERENRAFADGVGDACDPRPKVGGDKLRAYFSFASDDDASAWTGGGFSIAEDAVHAGDGAVWTSTRAHAGDGLFVRAHASSIYFGATGELSITLDGDGIGAGGTCALAAGALTAREAGGTSMSVDLAQPIVATEPLELVAWRGIGLSPSGRLARLTCRVTQGSAMKEAILTLTDDLTSGSQVIAVRDASVTITSVSVYTSPPPKEL